MFKKGESHSCYTSPQTHFRQETALLPPTEPQAEEVRASKAPPLWSSLPLLLSTREPLFILLSIHIGMGSWLFYTRGHNPILPYFDTKNCSGLATDRQLCSWFLWPSDIFPSVCEHMSELCGASSRTPWLSFPALGPVWRRNFHSIVPDNVTFSFLWSPHRVVSQFLWLFPVPNWETMLSGPLGSYRETGTQQHHPSRAIPPPGLWQGALKSTAVLGKLSLKIQGKGEREGKKMPWRQRLCLKDDQCFSGVNYICF